MLTIVDYIVIILALLISVAIGLYYRRQSNAEDYLLANGKMSSLPVGFSLMASFMSAITLLGVTKENYTYGTQFVVINFAYILGTPIAAYIFLPVFFAMESPSAYAYLEKRFGLVTRLMASLAFSLQMILYMGIVVYAPALALSAVTQLSFMGSVLAVGFVCTFYSTLGGIKAVLITDVFQSLLMFAAIGCVVIGGTLVIGCPEEVLMRSQDRLEFFNIDPDPTVRHTLWTQMIGGTFIFCSIYAVNQAQVQRLLSTKSLASAQRALWIQWPILALLSLTTSYAGLVIHAFYKDCDPIQLGRIAKSDQILPLFVIDTMKGTPGMAGLFISGIFSGSLSTVSSAINSLAAVTLEDYIKSFVTVKAESETLILKLLAFAYGVGCVLLTFLVEYLGAGILQASLTIFGVVGGPLLGLFSLGMMTRRANEKGALVGFLTAMAFLFWIGFGGPKPKPQPLPVFSNGTTCQSHFQVETNLPVNLTLNHINPGTEQHGDSEEYFFLYSISYAWYAMIGSIATFIVGYVSSLAFPKRENLTPNLFIHPIRKKMMEEPSLHINDQLLGPIKSSINSK